MALRLAHPTEVDNQQSHVLDAHFPHQGRVLRYVADDDPRSIDFLNGLWHGLSAFAELRVGYHVINGNPDALAARYERLGNERGLDIGFKVICHDPRIYVSEISPCNSASLRDLQ